MTNDLINIYRNNGNKEQYKLLCIIKDNYHYLVYTDIDNYDLKKNIYVAKTKNSNYLEEILPMEDSDWNLVQTKYQDLLNK